MTLKKKDLLTTGLTSEFFLLAFIRPDTTYGFAQRLQNTKGKPNTSKSYNVVKSLTTANYLKEHDDEKLYPNYTKLVSEIEKRLELEGKSFDGNEKEILKFVLKNSRFFGIFSIDVIQKMIKQKKRIHQIDALKIICDKIGQVATILLYLQENDPKLKKSISKMRVSSLKEIELLFGQLNEEFSDMDKKFEVKIDQYMKNELKNQNLLKFEWEIINDFRAFLGSFAAMIVFGFIPKKTLKKISLLWSEQNGFYLGVKMATSKKRKN